MIFFTGRIRTAAAILAFLCGTAVAAQTELPQSRQTQTDEVFLESLRALQLYETAIVHCQMELDRLAGRENTNTELWQRETAFYSCFQLQCRTDLAATVGWQKRTEIVDNIHEIVATWLPLFGNSTDSVLLRLQYVTALTTLGDLARKEAALQPNIAALRESAVILLRRAIREAEPLDTTVRTMIRETAERPNLFLNRNEKYLLSLRRYVQFQMATATRSLAYCYPFHSPEQIDGLTTAGGIFSQIAESTGDAPVVWQSRLEVVAVFVMLGEKETAQKWADEWKKRGPSNEFVGQLTAILQTVPNDVAAPPQLPRQHGPSGSDSPPTPSFAETDAEFIALKNQAETQFQRGNYEDSIAKFDLATARAATLGDTELAVRFAIKAAAVADFCAAQENSAQETAKEEWQRIAMERFVAAARRDTSHPQAKGAILIAIRHAAKRFSQQKMTTEEYFAILKTYLDNFPPETAAVETPPAETPENDSYWSLFAVQAAGLMERRSEWDPAIALLSQVSNDSEQGVTAVQMAQRLLRAKITATMAAPPLAETTGRIAALNPDFTPQLQIAQTAAKWFQDRGPDSPDSSGEDSDWSPADFYSELAAAEFAVLAAETAMTMQQSIRPGVSRRMEPQPFFDEANRRLARALAHKIVPKGDWETTANGLYLYTLVAMDRRDAALVWWKNITTSLPPNEGHNNGNENDDKNGNTNDEGVADIDIVKRTLEGLERTCRGASPTSKVDFANIRLQLLADMGVTGGKITEELSQKLTPSEQRQWRRLEAAALADAGRLVEAVSVYESLVKEDPNDVTILTNFASFLMTRSEKEAQAAARRIWERVERLAAPNSAEWWQAKESLIRLLHIEGEVEESQNRQKLLDLLRPR